MIVVGLLVAPAAHANRQKNGVQLNGVQLNGVQLNGVQLNGVQLNGVQLNGVQLNGVLLTGVQLNGSQLQGSFIGSGTTDKPFQCVHREDATGAKLPSSCSPCAALVDAKLSTCASGTWGATCVDYAKSQCKATISIGSSLTTSANTTFVITATTSSMTGNAGGWIDNADVWWNVLNWKIPHAPNKTGVGMQSTTPSACVQHVVQLNPECASRTWDSKCVAAATNLCTSRIEQPELAVAYGDSVCGYDKSDNAREAIFVNGVWNEQQGVQGGGAKSVGPLNAPVFSIGCRKVGAIAKCIDWGYKPWLSASHDKLHQACVRSVRDDLCGDGTSWTADGNEINIYDYKGIQTDTETLPFEFDAVWTAQGAPYIAWWGGGRANGAFAVTFLTAYKQNHPYCQTQAWDPLSNPPANALALDGNPNQIKTERVYQFNCGPQNLVPCP